MNENPATLEDQGRKNAVIATYAMMGVSVILLVIALANADGPGTVVFDILFSAIGIGIQVRMLQKINREWHAMDRSGRIRTVAIAVLAPLLVYLGFFVLVLFIVFWFWASVVPRLLGKSGVSGGTSILRAIFSSPATADASEPIVFGSFWGGDRVEYGSDGRVLRVGDQEVRYRDGRPGWVGDQEIRYDRTNRIIWVGNERVTPGESGAAPKWVGDKSVQP